MGMHDCPLFTQIVNYLSVWSGKCRCRFQKMESCRDFLEAFALCFSSLINGAREAPLCRNFDNSFNYALRGGKVETSTP